jgi:hypothetical protein
MTNKEQFTELVGNNPKLLECFKNALKDRDGYLRTRDWDKKAVTPLKSPQNDILKPFKTLLKKDGTPQKKKTTELAFKGITNVELSALISKWMLECEVDTKYRDFSKNIFLSIFRNTNLHKEFDLK